MTIARGGFPSRLTAGQQAVREIVGSLLPRYIVAERDSEGALKDGPLVATLLRLLAADPRVTADAVTGKQIYPPPFSAAYLAHLSHIGTATVEERAPSRVPINGFMYTHWELRGGARAYELGHKYDSTASVLFALANGDKLPERKWDLQVYVDHTLLVVRSGGVHRSLAHMLWGQDEVPVRAVRSIHAPSAASLLLNDAMLFGEQLRPGSPAHIARPDRHSDIEEMLRIYNESSENHRRDLKSYFSKNHIDMDHRDEGLQSTSWQMRQVSNAFRGLQRLDDFLAKRFWLTWSRRRAAKRLAAGERIVEWVMSTRI